MKSNITKLSISLLVLVLTFSACAQSSHLDRFYEHYHHANGDGNAGFDPGFLLSASFPGNHSDSEEGSWLKRITAVRCLVIDAKKTPGASNEWADLTSSLRADNFEEWFSVRKGQGRVQLLSRDKGDVMEEIACVIVGDDGSGLFFHLRGHFTAADRGKMESALQPGDSE
jgi:hypothetical protein